MNRPVPSQPLNKYRQNPMMNQSPIPPNGTVFPGQGQPGMPQPGMPQPGMPQQRMPQPGMPQQRQHIAPSPGMPPKQGIQPIIENPRLAQQQQARPQAQGQAQGQAQDHPQMKKFIESAMQAGHHPDEIMKFIGSRFGIK